MSSAFWPEGERKEKISHDIKLTYKRANLSNLNGEEKNEKGKERKKRK